MGQRGSYLENYLEKTKTEKKGWIHVGYVKRSGAQLLYLITLISNKYVINDRLWDESILWENAFPKFSRPESLGLIPIG